MPCVGQAAGVDQAGRKKEAPESIFYFCGKCLFFNSENTFLFGGTIYSMWLRWWTVNWFNMVLFDDIEHKKEIPYQKYHWPKNVMSLSKVEKKWASDQIWYNWLENTRKRPLIEHIPQKLEAFIMLPAGCPSCLTTLKGVWVKNTTDCLGWERTLLEREGC